MGYVRVTDRPEVVYHYTRRENLESILRDGRISRMGDTECWFCPSLEDTVSANILSGVSFPNGNGGWSGAGVSCSSTLYKPVR